MHENRLPGGSATRWGPLFGGRARNWAETWEGPKAGDYPSMDTSSTAPRSARGPVF